jgi:hypothetical protein
MGAQTWALGAGSHTLKIGYREANTKLDKLIVTSNMSLVPAGSGSGPMPTLMPPSSTPTQSAADGSIWFEAESGELAAPMVAASAAGASNSQIVWVPSGASKACNIGVTGGTATYTINVAQTGPHKIWLRALAPTTNSDSLCLSIDNGAYSTWSLTTSPNWIWNTPSSGQVTLSAGAHTIRIRYREVGAKFDRILITNNLGYIPQ